MSKQGAERSDDRLLKTIDSWEKGLKEYREKRFKNCAPSIAKIKRELQKQIDRGEPPNLLDAISMVYSFLNQKEKVAFRKHLATALSIQGTSDTLSGRTPKGTFSSSGFGEAITKQIEQEATSRYTGQSATSILGRFKPLAKAMMYAASPERVAKIKKAAKKEWNVREKELTEERDRVDEMDRISKTVKAFEKEPITSPKNLADQVSSLIELLEQYAIHPKIEKNIKDIASGFRAMDKTEKQVKQEIINFLTSKKEEGNEVANLVLQAVKNKTHNKLPPPPIRPSKAPPSPSRVAGVASPQAGASKKSVKELRSIFEQGNSATSIPGKKPKSKR